MVIQSNMSPRAIVREWDATADVFARYRVPLTREPIEELVEEERIPLLLRELNAAAGSSAATCTGGG